MFKLQGLSTDFVNNFRYFAECVSENSTRQNNDSNRKYSFFEGLRSNVSIPDSDHSYYCPIKTRDVHKKLIRLIVTVYLNPAILHIFLLVGSQQIEKTATQVCQI